jgi:hypothetical protein
VSAIMPVVATTESVEPFARACAAKLAATNAPPIAVMNCRLCTRGPLYLLFKNENNSHSHY